MTEPRRVSSLMATVLWLVVLAVTAWLYWPGIDGPAMLDDRASVTVMDELDANPGLAMDYVFGDAAGPLGRPVSMASFVVEKLYLNQGIRGGKQVNIVLHLFIGSLVAWLLLLLLRQMDTPGLPWLALLAAAAWLLSPLYVSTVLYVVQRMAMLAAMFILSACISYIYWRRAFLQGRKMRAMVLLAVTVLLLILAVFAKEPGIVGVPVVLLLEALWFRFRGPDGEPLRGLRHVVLGAIIAGAAFVVLFFSLAQDWLVNAYVLRDFTPAERILTQSRILWDYLGQLLSPDVLRMGLFHDDWEVSRSLTQPPVTAVAVMAWGVVVAGLLAALRWRWGGYLAFAAALYLVGHSTESTILPLELYYEHRNYFPGVGLFLGLAVLLALAFKRWPEILAPTLAWGWVLVLALAMKTSSQVQVWSSAPLLYLNDVNAHPTSFRANANMASQLAGVGALEGALAYSARAHRYNPGERQGDYDLRDLSLSCDANKPLPAERIASLGTTEPQRPLSSVGTLNVLVRQLQNGDCPDFDRLLFADRMAAIFLQSGCCAGPLNPAEVLLRASPNIYAGLAVLENALERYDNAYRYTEMFLLGSPGNVRGLLMKLHFATALGKQEEAAALKAQLHNLEEAGELTLAEQQTLSLYKDN